MGRVRFTPEQIIGKLREAELLLGQGMNIAEAVRKLGVSEQTYYRWRKEYGVSGAMISPWRGRRMEGRSGSWPSWMNTRVSVYLFMWIVRSARRVSLTVYITYLFIAARRSISGLTMDLSSRPKSYESGWGDSKSRRYLSSPAVRGRTAMWSRLLGS